ncbi:ABC transporter substrate-binding protein [Halobellus rubicundus]|uniref:ABC transporter substrate-binding protein n=1 Tax=Halobellus rubicundus TaxID=2996466 RepID=A0ABD5MGM5_9EURY
MTDQRSSSDQSRRRYLKSITAGGLAVGLAGCQGNGGGGGNGTTAGSGGGTSTGGGDELVGEEDPIGNWPPEGDSVTISFNGPESGGLGPDGQDQREGFDLIIDHLNNGGGLVDNTDLLSGNGVLGYEVESTAYDTATNAQTARENAQQIINQDNAQFWTGGMSSTVTIAMEEIAAANNVPFMAGNSTSSSISGENCSRYYFHPTFHAEIIGMMMGEAAPAELGEDRSLFHIYMDYSYGQSNSAAATKYLVDNGPWELAGEAPIAEDENDHSSQISALQESGADVLYFSSFGGFAASGLQQMVDAGLTEEIDVIIPHVSAFTLNPMGSAAEGVYGGEPWNPGAGNEASEIFVQAFEDEYDATPNQSHLHTYESVLVYAMAVEQAGTFHPPTVIRELENFEWSQAWGDSQFRECDHQVERPYYFVRGVGDDRAEELGIRTEVVRTTEPLVYGCNEAPATNCELGPYGDE